MSSWTSPALGVKFSPEKNKTQERNFYESLVILRTLEEWVTCESLWLWDLNCGMTKSINKTLKELIFFRLNFPFLVTVILLSILSLKSAELRDDSPVSAEQDGVNIFTKFCSPLSLSPFWAQFSHFSHLHWFAKPWFFDTKHLSRRDHLLPFSLLMDGATLLQRKICLFSHPVSD